MVVIEGLFTGIMTLHGKNDFTGYRSENNFVGSSK